MDSGGRVYGEADRLLGMDNEGDPPMARRMDSTGNTGSARDGAAAPGPSSFVRSWSLGRRGPGCGCLGCVGVLALLLLAAWLVVRGCERLSEALVPRVAFNRSIVEQVVTQLGELEVAPRFVVGTREIVAETTEEDTTEVAATWLHESLRLPIGKTVTRVRATGNRVQYVVDLREIDVSVSADGHAMQLLVPAPRVDDDVVDVQSDPAGYEILVDKDWLHHVLSAQADIDAARRALRGAVVAAGAHPAALLEAREEAKPLLEALIKGMLPPGSGIESIEVQFGAPQSTDAVR